MKVFYYKNKFVVSGRGQDVRHFIHLLQLHADARLSLILAERVISRRVHSFVIREYAGS
ncbi:hypothetical protein [Sulfoacidibacillus thermotolerans]|uniref:hypothetical protein n=1 Tax=Sulfoacidibacillus thermotolerans TaxID=1765684 RepID=UPI0015E7F74D|nr:hypothetical protein [Sulfoacidibacillus thermotolerans]